MVSYSFHGCNFVFPRAIFKCTVPDLLRIITIEFDADRTIWPRCDNIDVTSRYHSSADKAAGSPIPPKSLSEQTTRRKRKETLQPMETTGCQRGHSGGRYLCIFVGSGFEG